VTESTVSDTPTPQQVRGWAQEVISSHLQGHHEYCDHLLDEYCECADGALLEMMLAFFRAAVHIDQPATAQARFFFAMSMLGDLVELIAGKISISHTELAVQLVRVECDPAMDPSDRRIVRAAQVALVSHTRVRKGEKPFGVQKALSAQDLSDLVGGVMCLTDYLCDSHRAEVGDVELIKFLLPMVASILKMAAAGYELSVHAFTQELWTELLLGDCGGPC